MGVQDNYDDAVDATTATDIFTAEPHGKVAVTTVVAGTVAGATYALEIRERDGSWVEYKDLGNSNIADTTELSCAEVRLVIKTAATSGTDEVYFAVGDDS